MKATTRRPPIIALAFVMVMVVRVGSIGASGDIEPVLVSIDCFLERQMDRFWPPPEDYPPEFQDAQLIQTYDVEESDPEFVPLYHRAETYDAALAAACSMRGGNLVYATRLLEGIRFTPSRLQVAAAVWDMLAPMVAQGDAQANPLWVSRRYVDDDAPEGGDGMSWNTAYKYLQDALWEATSDDTITEIRVAQGTYKPDQDESGLVTSGDRTATFQLITDVAISGGYAGYGALEPDERNVELYETILSGDLEGNDGPDFENNHENSFHVVTGSGTTDGAILDGFTLTAGNANGDHPDYDGGGMYIFNGSPTLISCTFLANAAADSGGGMCNSYGSPSLTDCTFVGNRTEARGGGMFNEEGGNPTLSGCAFLDNSASQGGGLHNRIGGPELADCTFTGNTAGQTGGGMSEWGGVNAVLNSCRFEGNHADFGGGVFAGNGSNLTLHGCVLQQNTATWDGGGMASGESNPTLTNCTFTENSAGWGGGMTSANGSPTLTGCTFTGNTADNSGGMGNWQSSPTLTGCTFSQNAALLDYGGGMNNSGAGAVDLSGCTFSANFAAEGGGGMHNSESSPILTECVFDRNTAGGDGGGLSNDNSSPMVDDCIFRGNSAAGGGGVNNWQSDPSLTTCTFIYNSATQWSGGGMRNGESSPTLTGCLFVGNSAEDSGGAMSNGDDSDATSIDCAFISNLATNYGGALHSWNDSDLALTNCTLSGNSAQLGGGISSTDSCATLVSSILWGNVDVRGWGAFFHVGSGAPMVDYCCIQDEDPEDQDVYAGAGNIDDDPLFTEGSSGTWTADATYDPETGQTIFVDVAGGWMTGDLVGKFVNPDTEQFLQGVIVSNTETEVMVLGDFSSLGVSGVEYTINNYHLSEYSPCVNQGSNYTPDLPEEDIEGGERIQHCRVDMGAYESPFWPPYDDCNENGVDDDCEIYNAETKDYNENHVPDRCEPDCNQNGTPDFADLLFGSSENCNFNAIPDECEADEDCNANGVQDICDIAGGGGVTPFANGLGLPQDIVESEGEYWPGFFVTSVSPSVVYHVSPLGGNVTIFTTDLSRPVGARMVPDEFGGRGNRLFVVNQLPPRLVVVDESGNVDGDSFAGVDDAFDELGVEFAFGLEYVPLAVGGCAAGKLVMTGSDWGDAQGGYVFLVDQNGNISPIVEPPAPRLWTPTLAPGSPGEFGNSVFIGELDGPGIYGLDLQICGLARSTLVPFDENMRGIRQIAFSPVGWASSLDPTLEHERVLLVSTTSSLYLGDQVVKSALMMWDPQGRLVAVMRKGPDGLDIAPRGLHFVVDDLLIADNIECHGALRRASVDDFGLSDCNFDGVPDECEINDCVPEDPHCQDCNENGVPDGCERDCNGNGIPDECEIDGGTSHDCNGNGVPDECDDESWMITGIDPPSGAIDARQPTSVDGSMAYGWKEIVLAFDGDAAALNVEDFSVREDGGTPPVPGISSVRAVAESQNHIRVTLTDSIEPGAWTTITYDCNGSHVRLGYLPGDVDQDKTSAPGDIDSLIAALNSGGGPDYATDINCSGGLTAQDLLREIDLLNGAGDYEPWMDRSLP